MPQRVLVIDDVDEVRTLIRRVLNTVGYEVDSAGTLAEARGMHPRGYDVVLVDAHLGAERGIDLVDELRSEDPAAAGRCLLMTGGAIDVFPDDVACLAKPFQPRDLLDAVRKLPQAAPAPVPPESGDPGSGSPGSQLAAGGFPALQLLAITRRVRARERNELVDFLHDGPLQDLTAASLELHLMRRSAAPDAARSFDEVLRQLETATGSLRWLVDGNWPFLRPEGRLAASLHQRTAWLVAAPVTVDVDERRAALDLIDIPAIVDIVEMMLLGLVDAGLRAEAHIAVHVREQLIEIELTVTCAAEDGQPIEDPATAQASLDELASALQARAQIEPSGRQWTVRMALDTKGIA